MIEQLKKTPIVQIACEKVGLARATYYRWYKKNKKFAKEADEALAEGIKFLNDFAESQLLMAIKNQNLTAITYWLNHRHPAYKNTLKLSGSIKSSNDPLTTEQAKAIKQALELVSPQYFLTSKEN